MSLQPGTRLGPCEISDDGSRGSPQSEGTDGELNHKSPSLVGPLLFFAALAALWSYPLAFHLSTHIPGGGAGDNLSSLWNLWWMREALASPDLSFFRTDYLFYPYGVDLTLHTHTALNGFLATVPLAGLPLPTALNVLLLFALTLNGFCAYLLAHRVCGQALGAIVAGVIFGGSPFLMVHLLGHFNLTSAWGIPLFILLLLCALERTSRWAAPFAGVVIVLIAYTDYYYFLYASLFAVCYLATRWVHVHHQSHGERSRPIARSAQRWILGLLLADGLLICWIALSGGGV